MNMTPNQLSRTPSPEANRAIAEIAFHNSLMALLAAVEAESPSHAPCNPVAECVPVRVRPRQPAA